MDENIGVLEETEQKDTIEEMISRAFQAYKEKNFLFEETNGNPTRELQYTQFRARYGEKPTREQVENFYTENGFLNCSLLTDWQIALLEEGNHDLKGTKYQMINYHPEKKIEEIGHAFIQIKNTKGEGLFYEPQNKVSFHSLNELLEYYRKIFRIDPEEKLVALEAY